MKGTTRVGVDEVAAFLDEASAVVSRIDASSRAAAALADIGRRVRCHEVVVQVVGETTRGKSTLINALIDDRLLPARPLPTTRLPHVLRWGPELRIRFVVAGADDRFLHRDELLSLNEMRDGYEMGDGRIIIDHPTPFLRGGVVLVDTPGVNDLNEARDELVFDELPAADGVVMVVDGRHALTRTEGRFLVETLPAPVVSRMILVLTKMDRLDQAEREQVQSWVADGLGSLGISVPVFAVSSIGSGEGIGELRRAIGDLVARHGGGRTLDSLLTRAGLLLEGVGRRLGRAEELLDSGVGRESIECERLQLEAETEERRRRHRLTFEQGMAIFREDLAAARQAVCDELALFGVTFARAIPESLDGASDEDIRRFLPSFIRDTFADWIDEAMPPLHERLRQAVGEAARILEDGASVVDAAEGEDATKGAAPELHLSLESRLSKTDVGVVALGLCGTLAPLVSVPAGGLLTAGAAVAAMRFRRRRDELMVSEARRQAPAAVEETARSLSQRLSRELTSWENETVERFEQAYQDGVAEQEAALATARAVRDDGGAEDLRHSLQLKKEELRALNDHLARLRARLLDGDGVLSEESTP